VDTGELPTKNSVSIIGRWDYSSWFASLGEDNLCWYLTSELSGKNQGWSNHTSFSEPFSL